MLSHPFSFSPGRYREALAGGLGEENAATGGATTQPGGAPKWTTGTTGTGTIRSIRDDLIYKLMTYSINS